MKGKTAIKKLGVIGAGSIASHHLRAAQENGFVLDSICARDNSENSKRLGQEFRFRHIFSTFEELLISPVDAYLVLTNTKSQVPIARRLLEKKKPILIEKPVSTNPFLIQELDLEDKFKQVAVGYNRRNLSSIHSLRSYLSRSPMTYFTLSISELSTISSPNTEQIEKTVLENTVHVLDLVIFLFGKPDYWKITGIDFENRMFARTLNFFYGGIHKGTILITIGTPDNWSMQVYSPGHRFVLSPLESFVHYNEVGVRQITPRRPNKVYVPLGTSIWKPANEDIKFKAGFYRQMEDFYKFVTTQERPDTLASLSEAFFASTIAQQILQKI